MGQAIFVRGHSRDTSRDTSRRQFLLLMGTSAVAATLAACASAIPSGTAGQEEAAAPAGSDRWIEPLTVNPDRSQLNVPVRAGRLKELKAPVP